MIGDLIKLSPEDLPRKREKPRKPRLWRRRWVQVTFLLLVIGGVAGWFGVLAYLKPFREKAEEYDLNRLYVLEEATLVLDRSGREIGRLGEQNRQIIPFARINKRMIDALVAQEDSRFWTHDGVDKIGIMRAAWTNIKAGRFSPSKWTQGASTITQQLARQGFGNFERTKERKFLEWFLAQRITERFKDDKSEILNLYLNRIYFGEGFYGVESAAQGYFGKPTSELDYEECATLVGLIKNPTRYSPFNNPDLSRKERDDVLERMVVENMLSSDEAAKYKARPLVLNPAAQISRGAGWVQKEIQKEADAILEQLGYASVQGKGFKIHTTIDGDLQKISEESMRTHLDEIERHREYPKRDGGDNARETPADYAARLTEFEKSKRPNREKPQPAYLQGGSILMDNTNGAILAMVGGRDYAHSEINHTRIKRPAGTVFAPFVYAAAFEGNHFPGSRVSDEPMDNTRVMIGGMTGIVREWGRESFDGAFTNGTVSLRHALAEGHNNGTARLGLEIGVERVRDFAARAGMGEIAMEASSLLGRSETTLRDVCMAYSAFSRGGVRPSGYRLVTKIEDPQGRLIFQRSPEDTPVRVTDPVTAWMVTSCLEDALNVGTGAPCHEFGLKPELHAMGKTGTHLSSTDLWFAGGNTAVTCAVWIGLSDRPRPVYPDAYSNRTALPVWVDMMNATASKWPSAAFPVPSGLEKVNLCRLSGQLGTDACLERQSDPEHPDRMRLVSCSYEEFIRAGRKVDRFCEIHAGHAETSIPDIASVVAATPSSPTGVSTDAPAATAVKLKGPTIIGTDPYESVTGTVAAAEPDPGEENGAKIEPPKPVITAPVIDPTTDDILRLPKPDKATID